VSLPRNSSVSRNSGGRKRSISMDQVTWVTAGARTPPVICRSQPKTTLVISPASTSAGLPVAAVEAQ
jgi:hypothetical protein